MPKKGDKKRFEFVESDDPHGLVALMNAHLEARRMTAQSERTVWSAEWVLSSFIEWCHIRGLLRPDEITQPILERFQRNLFQHRKSDGTPLSPKTQAWHLTYIRVYFRWLTRKHFIPANPAADLDMPKIPTLLPRQILTVAEVERLLAVPDLSTPFGLRDRALMEVFYSTGIRRRELAGLSVWDIDHGRNILLVRQGKGGKDRYVPIGTRAVSWVDRYLQSARVDLVVEPDCGALFLTYKGQGFNPDVLTSLVTKYVKDSGIEKKGSCHLFRHTMATLMLEGGADIRYVQMMLGHASLDTTQIYTQVAIQQLQNVHSATHPGATEAGRESSEGGGDDPTR